MTVPSVLLLLPVAFCTILVVVLPGAAGTIARWLALQWEAILTALVGPDR
jgi:hypothetical protein